MLQSITKHFKYILIICIAPTNNAVAQVYYAFSKDIDGMVAIDRISRVKTKAHGPLDKNAPWQEVLIRSITVIDTE